MLTPDIGKEFASPPRQERRDNRAERALDFIRSNCLELSGIPKVKYPVETLQAHHDWYHVCALLAQDYIPEHEAVLNASQLFAVSDSSTPED